MPKTAVRWPEGNGGTSGRSGKTAWVESTAMVSIRPGSAFAALTSEGLLRPNHAMGALLRVLPATTRSRLVKFGTSVSLHTGTMSGSHVRAEGGARGDLAR